MYFGMFGGANQSTESEYCYVWINFHFLVGFMEILHFGDAVGGVVGFDGRLSRRIGKLAIKAVIR